MWQIAEGDWGQRSQGGVSEAVESGEMPAKGSIYTTATTWLAHLLWLESWLASRVWSMAHRLWIAQCGSFHLLAKVFNNYIGNNTEWPLTSTIVTLYWVNILLVTFDLHQVDYAVDVYKQLHSDEDSPEPQGIHLPMHTHTHVHTYIHTHMYVWL